MSVRTVASFTLEQRMSLRFNQATDLFLSKNLVPGALKGVYQGYAQFSLFAAFGLLYWFGGTQVSAGKTDFDGMLIPIFCMFMLGAGLGQAANGATDAAKAAEACERVFDVVDREPKIDYTKESGGTLPKVQGQISFRNVKLPIRRVPTNASATATTWRSRRVRLLPWWGRAAAARVPLSSLSNASTTPIRER